MKEASAILRAMADRIDRNAEEDFAGCIVLIAPPEEHQRELTTIEILLIDPDRSIPNFWSLAVKTTEIAAGQVMEQHSAPPMGGYR